MKPGTLMVQGTTSDAGKSTLVAALCRILARNAIAVAPFKPQNMALNSAVTEDDGEIGRAQALQALACYLPAHSDFNPVLIKPSSDVGAQIIVKGKVLGNMEADTFHRYKPTAKAAVFECFNRLHTQYQAVIIEGAGSPAEINLREGDIANMGFAETADCPVILIADIDKGGVFAHLVGTLELLSPSEQNRVKGFVINKFRGDINLLTPGLEWLEERTGKPVLGVLPYVHDLYIDAEDAIESHQAASAANFKIVVPVFPRISNHTDLDALRLNPRIDLQFVSLNDEPPPCDLIILPGSKNVRDDLGVFMASQWPQALTRHLRYGGKVIGLCGGYQMLGNIIHDPNGVEGPAGSCNGLTLLPVETTLAKNKTLKQKQGNLCIDGAVSGVEGYEIHHGKSKILVDLPALLQFNDQTSDGCISEDNQVLGAYLHGIFDNPRACEILLQWAGLIDHDTIDLNAHREKELNRLADITAAHLDMDKIMTITAVQARATPKVLS